MPKFNMYQSLHTTVIGPEGLPLEIQIRTREMHDMAEYGVAAHWIYKQDPTRQRRAGARRATTKLKWLRSMLDWQQELHDPKEFMENLKVDLFDEEVFVFTPKGEVKSLAAGRDAAGLRLRGPHRGRPPLRRREGQRQDRPAQLPADSRATSSRSSPPSATAARRATGWRSSRRPARATRSSSSSRPSRARTPSTPAASCCRSTSRSRACRAQKIAGSPLLADVIREMGFRKADDFYIALGGAKISPKVVVNKVMQRLKQGEAAEDETDRRRVARHHRAAQRRQPTGTAGAYGIRVEGVDDVMLRLAKCCRPVPGDPIVGYVSLGRGITIHRDDCPNTVALRKDPERFVRVALGGRPRERPSRSSSRSTPGTATACSRTCRGRSPRPASTSSRRAASSRSPMVQNRFVVEVADTQGAQGRPSAACATSTASSTPTASRRAPG